MPDYSRLTIQADELALSYRARLARFHGWSNATLAARHLEDWVNELFPNQEKLSPVEVLAAVAGKDVTTFVRNHTMLPFQRAVVTANEAVPHGSEERRSLLVKRAHCATRKNLYFCPTCATKDIKTCGSAYWRRSHQLPGMLWCPEHKTALKSIPWTFEHMDLPNDFIGTGESIPVEMFVTVTASPNVHRYYDICMNFMQGKNPIHAAHISKVIKDRYREILLESDEVASNAYLATPLDQIFNSSWLDEILARWGRSTGQSIQYIQSYCTKSAVTLTPQGYALLLTSLYETSEEAIDAIRGLSSKIRVKKSKIADPDPWAFDEKAMRDAYFAGHGNHVTIAKTLGISRQEVKKIMTVLGLPSLGRNNTSKLQCVVDKLLYGNMSLEQVCSEHGLQLQDARCRLMEAMGPLYEAIYKLQMSSKSHAKSSVSKHHFNEMNEELVFT